MPRALSIAALVLSVTALLLVMFDPLREASPAPAPVITGGDRAEAEYIEIEGRLTSVELAFSSLMRRVEALERNASARPGDAASATPAAAAAAAAAETDRRQFQSLRNDVDALLAGDSASTEEGRKRLKDVMRNLQAEMFAERAALREQRRVERFDRFAEEAHLTATQKLEVTRLLEDERNERRSLFTQAAETGSRANVREKARELRERTDEAAKRLLSTDQAALFEAMRREDRDERRPGGTDPSAPRRLP